MKASCLSLAIGVLPLISSSAFAGHFCELADSNLKLQSYLLTNTSGEDDLLYLGLGEQPAAVILSQAGAVSLLTGTYKMLPTRTGQQFSYQLKNDEGASVDLAVMTWLEPNGPCGRAGCDLQEVVTGRLTIDGGAYVLSCKKTSF